MKFRRKGLSIEGTGIPQEVGRLAQRLVYEPAELVVSLGNSLKQREYELQQRKTIVGRFLALFDDRDPATIELDGMRIRQLFDLTKTEPHQEIDLNSQYIVDIHEFRSLLEEGKKRVPRIDGSYIVPERLGR